MYILKTILYLTFLISLTNGYIWRDYNGTIPDDAVPGHFGRFIGHVDIPQEGPLPLTIYPNQREGVGELHGKKVYKDNVKILCKHPDEFMYWRYVDVNAIPEVLKTKNLVVGGRSYQETLYIGRMFHEHEWKISKVFPPFPGSRNLGVYMWLENGDNNKWVEKFYYFEILFYNN